MDNITNIFLYLKIVASDDLSKELICYCSKTTTIKEFSDFICDRLDLDPTKVLRYNLTY